MNKRYLIIYFIILLSFNKIFSQDSLTINLAAIGVIEGSIESMTDNILVTINNNYATETNVYLLVGIVGQTNDGQTINIDNRISARDNIINIPSTGFTFTLTNLITQFQNTTLSDYNITPASFIDQIRLTRQLPAGNYTICMEAINLRDQVISAPGENNCLSFSIVYQNPPVIQTPLHNTWVGDNDDNMVIITWAHDYINPFTSYTVEIVRFPSYGAANAFMEDGRPQQTFETSERILTQEVTGQWTFNTISADVVPTLNPGDVLAVRVTATSENAIFANEGRSDINVFIFGVPESELCNNPSLNVDWAFPSIGDTLPFKNLFPVARFQPSCDNILEMNASIHFGRRYNGALTGTNTVTDYEDNWRSGPGPKNYLRNYFNRHFSAGNDYFPLNSEYEQYLPFLNGNTGFTAERAEQVSFFGVTNFTFMELPSNRERTQTLNLNAMNTNGIVIGMPTPKLESPANDAVVAPGPITFRFNTGDVPGNPLPPFKIFSLQGNNYPLVPGLQVNEKCVLQVANDISFNQQSLVFCRLKKVQGNPYHNGDSFNEDNPTFEPFSNTFDNTPQRQFDQDHFLSDVYKDISISNDFSNEETLYWRVVWLRFPESYNLSTPCGSGIELTNEDIYHTSSIRRLIINNNGLAGELETQDCALIYVEESEEGEGGSSASSDSSNCASPCVFPNITDTNVSGSLSEGTTFTIAGFDAEVKTVSGGSNGTAVITIPFINNIKLRVNFSGLQLNAARQMINGTIEPIIDQTFPMSNFAGPVGRIFGMDETAAEAMEAALEGGGKLLSLLSSGSEISLPLGIDRDVAGQRIVIGIPNITFRKDTAYMNVVVNLNLPNLEILEGFISLGAQVCITKNGFANDVKLYLPQDQIFPLGSTNEFRIKGAEGRSDPMMMTSVEWDCNGFKALNLVGAIRFTREWLLPENERGIIQPTGQVEARFAGRIANGGNVLLRLDMDNFQIPGADGWGFTPARNAWIDLSDIENPLGFMAALPTGYTHASMSSEGMQNTWKGFFMEELSVRTPERLQGPDRNRLTFALRNMFIDNTGITFRASAENILRWDGSGNMAGWAASLDTVFLEISQNNFEQFGFNGKLGIPIAEETEYLIYQGALQHRRDSFNLLLSVRLADDIRIPISMANAIIRSDSYIEVSLGTNTYIEAGLNATLSIGNNNLPSGQTMASSVTMPGIEVENLVINSETGFDTTNFSYSLTGMGGLGGGTGAPGGGDAYYDEEGNLYFPAESNEGSMSGFPIGLDHFSISNDKITFQPRLTLSGSEGGFSAAAKISLLINMDLLSSPQRFDVTGVNLERIDLDISASDVTMRGYLEFYKTPSDEGVRGGLTVGLNLGMRVGIDINADFGTRKQAGAVAFNSPQWFSYFYVDGTVVFTPGITIFSGVSIYGLGGGFYHHMRMANSLPSGGNVMTGGGRPSGVRYEPYFETDLGLKFKVILGSNDNGQAYNLDVGIEAQFSFRHGLTRLAIEGSFRVMTDGISVTTIGREGNSPVAGYVGLELNMPPGGPTVFNGQFFVKVKVPADRPMIRGIGTIPNPPSGWTSENAMVWAMFKASDTENYFHMGTPTNRGGLSLNFGGGADLLRITSYLMIGDGIPLVMPAPDAQFTRIFNRGMGANAVTSMDGDVSELLNGNPREGGAAPTGQGFAMGLTIAMNTGDIEFFPFFFNLSAIMGCDINVTKASPEADRRCAGSDRVPGTDGWYATGQFYAGIEGAFGIKINLFVEEIKVNILEASAAIILRGGLPNPEWVSGRGSFYYNVCNGLAEGNCNFTFEAGTVCMPVTGNPFGGVSLIQDIEPEDGATDVNIYTDVSAAFSMDMNKTYEFQEYISAIDPPVIRRLQPYMHSFELRKQGSSTNLTGEGTWTEANHIYTLEPIRRLDPESVHTLRVEARIRENGRDLLVRGVPFREERLHTFTTGLEPDKIVDDNLKFTYPYINQQTFYKGETRDNQGYVRCKTIDNRCFLLGDVSEYVREFSVRFTDEDGNVINSPARVLLGSSGVTFPVNQLLPDKLYCVQIIRKDTPINPTSSLGNAMHQAAFVNINLLNANINRALQITNLITTVGNNVINSNQYKRINLPSGKVGQYEKELYTYFFKTSKYNSLADKIRAEANGWENETHTFGVDFAKVKKSMQENFEWVDLQDFKVVPQSNLSFSKRIKFLMQGPPTELDGVVSTTPIRPNQYLMEVVRDKVIGPYNVTQGFRANAVRAVNQTYPGIGNQIPMLSPIQGYQPYNASVYFSEQSRFAAPLSQDAINNAFTEIIGTNSAISNSLNTLFTNSNVTLNPLLLSFPTANIRINTIINYEPTIAAWTQYTDVRRILVNFMNSRIERMFPLAPLFTADFLSANDKTYLNRHVARSSIMSRALWVNWTKGPQTFGMQYIFPDQNGNDVNGTLSPFTFRL